MDIEMQKQALVLKIQESQQMIYIILNGVLNEGEQGITSNKLKQFLPSLVQHHQELTVAETELRVLNSL